MLDIDPSFITLAQGGAAPPPGTATVLPDAGGGAQPAGGKSQAPGGQFMIIMLGVVAMIFIFSIMGPRREKKRREALLAGIKKHDRVQTVGGVIGAIVELKQDVVILKVDESANTRMTFAKSAVQQVLSSDDEEAKV